MTPASSPQVSSSQRQQQMDQALDRANEIRLARAQLRAKIRNGEIFAASVLLELPAEALSWRIGDLLMSQRKWGTKRMQKALVAHHISEVKPLRLLTERQRRLLATALERRSQSSGGGRSAPAGPPLELGGPSAAHRLTPGSTASPGEGIE
jgi:hypothetical protein